MYTKVSITKSDSVCVLRNFSTSQKQKKKNTFIYKYILKQFQLIDTPL